MEMESEYAKRIVLAVVTNLNTRFVFAPLRSEAFGDIRGTIKSDHMELFPTWGEVEVNALEVELLGYRNRIPDHIQVGHLFRNSSEAQVFAELIPSSSNTPFELPRLKLAGARNLHFVPEHELRQNFEEKLPPLPLETRGLVEGHVLPDLGASSYSYLGKSVSDRGKGEGRLGRGCDPVFVERQLRKRTRGIDEPDNAGEMQLAAAADCATVEVVGPLAKKCRIDINRGLPVLEYNELETVTAKPLDKDAVAKSVVVIDSRLKPGSTGGPASHPPVAKNGREEEATLLTLDFTERDVVVKSAGALDVRDESNKRNGSGGSSSQADHPVVVEKLQPEPGLASVKPVEKLQPEPGLAIVKPVEKLQPGAGQASVKPVADSVPKTLTAWKSKRNSSSAVLSDGGAQLGLSGTEKLRQEPALVASQPENVVQVEVGKKVPVADTSSSGSESEAKSVPLKRTIKRGKQADKVEAAGLASKPENLEIGKKVMLAETSSRSSSSESEAESVPLKRSIKSGKQADKVQVIGLATPEKRVPSGGGLQNLNVTSKRGSLEIKRGSLETKRGSLEIENKSLNSKRRGTAGPYSGTTSGGSTGETGGQKSENPRKKSVSLHVKEEDHSSSDSDGNNGESDPGEGSKSGRRGESSAGRDSDRITSNGESSLQSSDGSESEYVESSSDESEGSEEMPQRGRKMDFSTPKDRIGGPRSNGRRSLGGVVDLKYQHFLDSQDGFDQLISLSQQKVIPGSQQSLDGVQDSIAPVSLADDSLSIDVVPDTQVPEQDFFALEPLEDKTKESSRSVKENVAGSRSAGQQGSVPAEAVEDIAEEGENCQSTGPPKNDRGGRLSVELILTGGSTTEKVPEPAQKEMLPEPKSEDSQQIRAAVQLARMSLAKGVTSVVVSSPSKRKSRRNQGVSSLENQGHQNVQKLPVERVAEVHSNQDKDAPIKDATGISLNIAVDDQTPPETNRLPTPIPSPEVGEDLGNVLLALKGEENLKAGSQTDGRLGAQAAAEANLGMPKQQGKRRHRAFEESGTQVPPEHTSQGDVNRPEEEDPSRGDEGLPANTGDGEPAKEEHSGKNLRKKSGSAPTTVHAAAEKKRREKGPKSLGSSKVSNGAAEDDNHAELPGVEIDERQRPDPAHSSPLVNNKGTVDREGQQTAVGDGESPGVIIQRTLSELQLPNVGKRRRKKKDRSEPVVAVAVAKGNDLPVDANQNDSKEVGKSQAEEDSNHGKQDPSGPASKSEPNDAGAEKDTAAPEHSNGEPAQKKRRERRRHPPAVSADVGKLRQSSASGKKDRDSRQDNNVDGSSSLPSPDEVDVVVVSQKSLHPVQKDTEETDAEEGNEHTVAADKESPIVVTEQKKSHKKSGGRAAATPSKKVRDLQTSLLDQSTKRIPNSGRKEGSKEETHVSQLSSPKKKGEEEEEHPAGKDVPALGKAPRINTLGSDGAKALPSLGEKMKKKWDKLKKPRKQSEPDVAQEMEQLDDPAVAEDPVNGLRTEGVDDEDEKGEEKEVSLKKKKKRGRSLEPATKAGNSEAVKLIEAPQVASVDDENPEQESSPEIVKRPKPKDSNGQTVKERAKKRKLEESSLKEDTPASQKRKVGGSKKGELSSPGEKPGNSAKKQQQLQQVTPPSSRRKRANNTTKSSEGGRGESTKKDARRTAGGRFYVDGVNPEDMARCPHGCGREFSGKTSAYFRHRKSCVLMTPFGRE